MRHRTAENEVVVQFLEISAHYFGLAPARQFATDEFTLNHDLCAIDTDCGELSASGIQGAY